MDSTERFLAFAIDRELGVKGVRGVAEFPSALSTTMVGVVGSCKSSAGKGNEFAALFGCFNDDVEVEEPFCCESPLLSCCVFLLNSLRIVCLMCFMVPVLLCALLFVLEKRDVVCLSAANTVKDTKLCASAELPFQDPWLSIIKAASYQILGSSLSVQNSEDHA